ncbi:MAG TPA: 16S rRNA (guanine(527)-N(7))-methyltransferase RsmG [Casimicrobiaceae bacterium]|nr:16S rRNA (guanine(527)-N(7))-methyltransferase RsmG [Casimicrobiaceae bacterium]
MRDALAAGLRTLNLDVGREAEAKLSAYLALIQKWNRTHNLTAMVDRQRMVSHHLLDSLAVLPHLPETSGLRIIDVGSGGGLPGIPLAICRPDWLVTLIDSSRKKAAFLQQAAIELPLRNVEVVAGRVETYRPVAAYDFAISRAYSTLATFVEHAGHLVGRSGRLLAMKGVYPRQEIDAMPSGARAVEVTRLNVPGVEAERHLVVVEVQPASVESRSA